MSTIQPNPNPPPLAPVSSNLSDQYKAYMTDVGNIGTRYTTTNGFYLSVITALLGILAYTKAGEALAGSGVFLGVVVSIFAVAVCWVWSRSIAFYGALFAIKFTVLREMETAGNLYPIFKREDDLRHGMSLLKNDSLIPRLLSAPFVLVLLFILWQWIECKCLKPVR